MEDKKVIFSETAKVFREERTLHYKEQEKVKEAVTKLHEINLQLSDEVEELEKTLLGKEPDMPEETDGDEE